jgi:(1->4)-alpha-D-glucan 1-alpha-D-glucosylmutase
LFEAGEYVPLAAHGARALNLCAFIRKTGDAAALIIAPHLVGNMLGENAGVPIGEAVWADTAVNIPEGLKLVNLFTGEAVGVAGTLRVADALKDFPVALLTTAL